MNTPKIEVHQYDGVKSSLHTGKLLPGERGYAGGESATPRTDDAQILASFNEVEPPHYPRAFLAVTADFARRLERETATLHAQIARLKTREGEVSAKNLMTNMEESEQAQPWRMPAAYSAHELRQWHVEEEYHPDKWRPARPCRRAGSPWKWECWRVRFVLAWRVFTGRNDCVYWGNMSGQWKNDQVKYRDAVTRPTAKLSP